MLSILRCLLIGISTLGIGSTWGATDLSMADVIRLLEAAPADSERTQKTAQRLAEKPPTDASVRELAQFHARQADLASQLGNNAQFAEHMRRLVALGGVGNRDDELSRLALAELQAGNLLAAQEAVETSLQQIARTHYGKRATQHAILVSIACRLGDLRGASTAIQALEREVAAGKREPWSGPYQITWDNLLVRSQARLAISTGRFAEAEALLQQALAQTPRLIAYTRNEKNRGGAGTALPENFYEYIHNLSLVDLAEIRLRQGRLTEAEWLARQAVTNSVRSVGRNSYYTGILLRILPEILLTQGRYRSAEQLARAGLDIFVQIGTYPDSLAMRDMRLTLASALVAQRNFSAALLEYRKIEDAYEHAPDIRARMAAGDLGWAQALIGSQRYEDANAMLERLVAREQQWLGQDHPDIAELKAFQAVALSHMGRREQALALFRNTFPTLQQTAQLQDEPSALREQRLRDILESYLLLLGKSQHGKTTPDNAIVNEAFQLADFLRNQSTQRAIAMASARSASGEGALAQILRKDQDLEAETVSLHRILRDLMNAPPEQQLPKIIADMQSRIVQIRGERTALQQDTRQRFPEYANLIQPRAPSLAEARRVLKPGEALLSLYATDHGTLAWAINAEGASAFQFLPTTRPDIARTVVRLRQALDVGDAEINALPPFDFAASYRLYRELLEPVKAGWAGSQHLLIASSGELSRLPPAVLTTAPPAAPMARQITPLQYQSAPWLLKTAAITQLPSASTLVMLRKLPSPTTIREAFAGFGDPVFSAETSANSVTRALRNSPNLQARGGGLLDYSLLTPLPDTREEILAIAQAVQANPEHDVYLGKRASVENVKKANLVNKRIVAFATHGLLPGEFSGVSLPSLALSNPGDGKHGLLTLEDILSLKLNADWVVLSACNTAAGDADGADAVSGLGRGFFFAGTRAILATHWPVETYSARLLVSSVFQHQGRHALAGRAESLRQASLQLMLRSNQGISLSHPLFWAPYTVIGDGG